MKKPQARKDDIVIQKMENETLVYDLKKNKAYCLNETSSHVWELCNGNRTATEIAEEMSMKHKTAIGEDFVYIALDQLGKDGLLDGMTKDYFDGLSRREVIRKVGFASVLALPVISAVVAPRAAMAQSGGALLDICTGTAFPQGSCNPGLLCNFTSTISIPFTTVSTGNQQCCAPTSSNILSGSRCFPFACNSIIKCDGTGFATAPIADPACVTLVQNTCIG